MGNDPLLELELKEMDNEPDRWDLRYFRLADHISEWSKDTTRVGAIVVGKNRRHISMGYNGFPPGVQDAPERIAHRPTKYLFTQHAERNAMDNAAFDCTDATLVTTMFPCVECAKSLISKGITRLVSAQPPQPLPSGEASWRDTVPVAVEMLHEAGVRITIIYQGDPPPIVKRAGPPTPRKV
jgi:dCMP deaminase